MFDSFRVVAVTPAGRRRYLEILVSYLLRQRQFIDEYHLWANTSDAEDLEYLASLERQHPGFIKVVYPDPTLAEAFNVWLKEFGLQKWPPATSALIGSFYAGCTDRRTIYLRLDDDLCYVAPDAVQSLLAFRVAHPSFLAISANVVNHPLCTFIHQRLGIIEGGPGLVATLNPFCNAGWRSGDMAARVHTRFLERLRSGRLDEMKFGSWIVHDYKRTLVNCICWFGRDLADYDGHLCSAEEEQWFSSDLPRQLKRPVCVCGDAIVAHFAYYKQRPYLEQRTSLLATYRELAGLPPHDDVHLHAMPSSEVAR
jgi:hypothetical protein